MDVALVPSVKDDGIVGGIKHPVQGDRQLDDAEIRPEVPTCARHLVNKEGTDFLGEVLGLLSGDFPHIVGTTDVVEKSHTGHLRAYPRDTVPA